MASGFTTRRTGQGIGFHVAKKTLERKSQLERQVKGGVELLIGIMPEKTGEMKRQTKAVEVSNGWAIRIGVDYWIYPNYGTAYIEGEFFLEEAVRSIRNGLRQDFSRS
jgi:hypothetical protein